MGRFPHDKIVVVTRTTPLEELIQRFGTRDQARFYIQHMGSPFEPYEDYHAAYQQARDQLHDQLPRGVRVQWLDRSFLPTFTFGPGELIVCLGPDGLVVNTAKYLDGQPVLALNPDPRTIDGVLIPFHAQQARFTFDQLASGKLSQKLVTMACARLNDGQTLHAVNDLFVGARTHISARYRLAHNGRSEDQSSSGLIISTGAGSTGWFRSVLTGASAVVTAFIGSDHARRVRDCYAFEWDSPYLVYTVREPFISRTSSADLAYGSITSDSPLQITSLMPRHGVIFSDGVEEDFLQFNSGSVATISLSDKRLRLLVPPTFDR